MPTWDGENIVIDMLVAMEQRVFALSAYTTAQTAFLNCVQRRMGTRLASFNAALERYAGRTKTAVDACESSGAPRSGDLPALARTTMFATYQRLSKQELATMRRTSSEYDLLLSTDLGREFLNSVSSPEIVKRYTGYIARGAGGGVSGQASATGFDCIPATAPSSLSGKLRALNCLIFDTPHSWWETNAVTLENRIGNLSAWPQYGFLATDADVCTGIPLPIVVVGGIRLPIGDDSTPDGPAVACRKHYVAYGSLQKFERARNSHELDATWNPVNKYLADSKFRRDIQTYGCQDSSWAGKIFCAALVTRSAQASVYHFGVAIINSKGWPVTPQDVEHGDYRLDSAVFNPEFVNCASPHIPQISNLRVRKVQQIVTAQWDFKAGCAVGINHVNFALESYQGNRALTVDRHTAVITSTSGATCSTAGIRSTCSYTFPQNAIRPIRTLVFNVKISIHPKAVEYGEDEYPGAVAVRTRL